MTWPLEHTRAGEYYSMVEPLLHFAVPFAAFTALGVKPKKAFLISLLALVPDLDVLTQIHRFYFHSVIPLIIAAAPLIPVAARYGYSRVVGLASLSYATHLFLDLFNGFTPILWPLYSQNVWLISSLNVHLSSSPAYTLQIAVEMAPIVFKKFTSLDAPLFTSEGLAIAVVLVAPAVMKQLLKRSKSI